MLSRALLLSVVIHLAVLLGQSPWATPFVAPVSGALQLTAVLRGPPPPVDAPQIAERDRSSLQHATVRSGVVARSAGALPRPAAMSEAVGITAPSPDSAGAVTEEVLGRYRLALARQARRIRHYPDSERPRGVAGEVVLSLVGDPGSGLPRILLERGSGDPHLDQAALTMITEAVGLVPLPAELQGRQLRAALTLHFSPTD